MWGLAKDVLPKAPCRLEQDEYSTADGLSCMR